MERKKRCRFHLELPGRKDDHGVVRKGEKTAENRVGIEGQDRKESPNRIMWLVRSSLNKTRLTATSENTQDITHTG